SAKTAERRQIDYTRNLQVISGHLLRRNRVGRGLQSPARVGEPDNPSLRLGPLQYGKVPARPVVDPRGARIVVLLEAQQAEMPRVRRRKARDFDIVAHHVFGCGERVDLALEELLLGVPARTPAQHAANIKVLAQDMPP